MYSQNATLQQLRSQNSLLHGLVQSLQNQIAAKNKETDAIRLHIKCKSPDYHLLLTLLQTIQASQPTHSHPNLTEQVNCALAHWGNIHQSQPNQDTSLKQQQIQQQMQLITLQQQLASLKADNSNFSQVIALKDTSINSLTLELSKMNAHMESNAALEREMMDKMKEKENMINTQEALIFGLEQEQKSSQGKVDELEMILVSKTQSIQELSQFLNSTNEKISTLEQQLAEYPIVVGDLRTIIASKEQSVLEMTQFVESLMKKHQVTDQREINAQAECTPCIHPPCENCVRLTQDLQSLRQMQGDMLQLMNKPVSQISGVEHGEYHQGDCQKYPYRSDTFEVQTQTEETIKQLQNLAQQNSDLKDLLSNIMITNHNKSFEEDKASKIEQEISEQISLEREKFNEENERLAQINHNLQIQLKKMQAVINTYEEQLKEAEEKLNVMAQIIMEVNQKEGKESQQEAKIDGQEKDRVIKSLTNALEMLIQHQEESIKQYQAKSASLQSKHNEAITHLESEYSKLASRNESLLSTHESLVSKHESLTLEYQKMESYCQSQQNEGVSLKREYQKIHELIELYQKEIERYKEELTEAEKKCVNMSELIIEITHKGQSRQSLRNGIDQPKKESQGNNYRQSIGQFFKLPTLSMTYQDSNMEGNERDIIPKSKDQYHQKVESNPTEVSSKPIEEVSSRPIEEVSSRPIEEVSSKPIEEVSPSPISHDRPQSSNPVETISFNNGTFRLDQQLQYYRRHYEDSIRSISVLTHHLNAQTEQFQEKELAFHRDILALERTNAQLNTLVLQLNRKLFSANPDENIQTFLQRRTANNVTSISVHDQTLGQKIMGRKIKRHNESYSNATHKRMIDSKGINVFNNGWPLLPVKQ